MTLFSFFFLFFYLLFKAHRQVMGWKGWQTFLTRAVSLTCRAYVPAEQEFEIVTAPMAWSKCISTAFCIIENGFEMASKKKKNETKNKRKRHFFLPWKRFGFKNKNYAVKQTTNPL